MDLFDGAFNQEIVVKTIDKRVKDPPSPKNKCHKIFKKCQTFAKKKVRKRISTVNFRTEKCPDKKIIFFFANLMLVCIHITLTNFILAKIYTPWALLFIFVIFSNMTSQFRKDDLKLNRMKTLHSNN